MLLSKSCVYGLRASIYLATKENGGYVPIKKISETLEISHHFLTKILQQLTADGLLDSYKGPNGGVKLKAADEITLMDIVLAIDGPDLLTQCALGLPGCGHQNPCPLHDKWASTRESIRKMLESSTLKQMVERGKRENLRLTNEGGFEKLLNS